VSLSLSAQSLFFSPSSQEFMGFAAHIRSGPGRLLIALAYAVASDFVLMVSRE